MQEHLTLRINLEPVEYQITYGQSLDSLITEVSGKTSQRQQYQEQQVLDGGASLVNAYISTTQQSAVADALTTASSYWYLSLFNVTAKRNHDSPLSDQFNSIHTLTVVQGIVISLSVWVSVCRIQFGETMILAPLLCSFFHAPTISLQPTRI